MQSIELLNILEQSFFSGYFIDLHIINDNVVGFYKTKEVKYKNINNEEVSYLFPTTFKTINGCIQTTMVFGSVERNFEAPRLNGTGYGTELITLGVGTHLYKLLAGQQYISSDDEEFVFSEYGLYIKSFICIIEALDGIGFPFIRITNNSNIEKDNFYPDRY